MTRQRDGGHNLETDVPKAELSEGDLERVTGGSGKRNAESVNHSEFKIVKLLDAASPKLY
jgi:hypothetical protein